MEIIPATVPGVCFILPLQSKMLCIIPLNKIDVLLGTARGQWEHPANHRGIKATGTLIAAVVFSKEQLYLVNPGVRSSMLLLGKKKATTQKRKEKNREVKSKRLGAECLCVNRLGEEGRFLLVPVKAAVSHPCTPWLRSCKDQRRETSRSQAAADAVQLIISN